MTVMIQIRNVPDDIHRTLKSRAAKAGLSLSDYLLGQIRETAERPTLEEMLERFRQQPEATFSISAADAIREERDKR